MKRKKVFTIFVTFIISIILLIVITNLAIVNQNVNQGKFRVSDVVLTSTAVFNDKIEESKTWSFDVFQKNLLSILITSSKDANIKRIYLSDIQIKGRNPLTVSQFRSEMKKVIGIDKEQLELEWELTEENQILIELEFLNEELLKNWTVPEGINEVRRDGTIFKIAGMSLNDIKTTIDFKLNIEETIGKINTTKVSLKIPNRELIENGQDIRRLNVSEFVFRTK